MKNKVLKWIFPLAIGFLAGVAFDYFVWGTSVKEAIFPLLCSSVVLCIVLFLFGRRDSKKKTQL
ncbi:MAG: hypothetical protein K2O66_06270 [Bacteroidales bacterium]|nr:hypothetical protein [Bacteroidales bacterium]MDE7072944.1 hypothetical protein [Bacteroidales bacterium]